MARVGEFERKMGEVSRSDGGGASALRSLRFSIFDSRISAVRPTKHLAQGNFWPEAASSRHRALPSHEGWKLLRSATSVRRQTEAPKLYKANDAMDAMDKLAP